MRYDDMTGGAGSAGAPRTDTEASGQPESPVRLAQASEPEDAAVVDETGEIEEEAAETTEEEIVRMVVLAREGEVVVLPDGTSLDAIEIRDGDIVLHQPDGTVIIIENGAELVPTIVIGDIEIPSEALAAVIEGIAVAAGPEGGSEDSSGLSDPREHPGMDDPFPIGPLLPPTALAFPDLDVREIVQLLADEEEEEEEEEVAEEEVAEEPVAPPPPPPVALTVQTLASLEVYEDGLPDGNEDNPEGPGDSFGIQITDEQPIEIVDLGFGEGSFARSILFTNADVLIQNEAGVEVNDLKSQGHDVNFTLLNGNSILVAYTGAPPENTDADNVVMVVEIFQSDGDWFYKVTLKGPFDHPLQDHPTDPSASDGSWEDILSFTFSLTVQNMAGETSEVTFVVQVDDDSPVVDAEGKFVDASRGGGGSGRHGH